MNRRPLTEKEEQQAKRLFNAWFTVHPDIKNPTDPNTKEKYEFIVKIGWKNLSLMQRARKGNVAANGYPYPWTKGNQDDGDTLF